MRTTAAKTPRAAALLPLAALTLTLAPGEADAQSKGGKAEMLRLSAEGDGAYGEGRFRDAAALFERAWGALPDPILRKNQAISWFQVYTTERAAGSTPGAQREACASAIDASQRFITESNERGELKLEDQRLVNTIMVQCYQDMASLDIKEDKLDDANKNIKAAAALGLKEGDLVRNDALRDEIERRRAAAAAPDKKDEAEVKPPAEQVRAEPAEGGAGSTLGWTLVGIGAAGFLGAGGAALYGVGQRDGFYDTHFGGQAPFDYSCNAADKPTSCKQDSEDMQSAVFTSNVLMFTGLGIGVAGVAAGVLLLMGDGEASQTLITPTFGPDSAGVMMEIKF